ncbi:MAG: YbhB/YbcL family Raf kinase inhibitor-like protein [Candidatus Latescibacterota bacterium]
MDIQLESTFGLGEMIPAEYSCDVEDMSPPLVWSNAPGETKSFAIIAEDADSSPKGFTHWVVYNIPGNVRELREGASTLGKLPDGAVEGRNDFHDIGYGGPCPSSGIHRYHFKIYALDTLLNLGDGVSEQKLLKAMEGHILAEGELVGRYGRMSETI